MSGRNRNVITRGMPMTMDLIIVLHDYVNHNLANVTKKQAKERLREIEDQIDRGTYLPNKKIPAFEKVINDWLDYKKANVRGSTWNMYKSHTENHFELINGTTCFVSSYIFLPISNLCKYGTFLY